MAENNEKSWLVRGRNAYAAHKLLHFRIRGMEGL